ncbi:hypothetical protein E9549_09235 [Blastococcus sp. MG754426]|uniref:hypothetical protein n=1 Tax=unclassified Blastococcus TaxID=2619396 RepID=UPI001F27A0D2|nr:MULTISPECIES: hypothetical protein [unclassified Blastococcus]MCF6507587.1 hypothetical protein [Blastococcus sp. MG754426]MCF6511979.1 hypothetical protein [Blastococcus sp. MG754427]MCF6735184.1 hypothetical protein [Blastococcus sp. KM273129]
MRAQRRTRAGSGARASRVAVAAALAVAGLAGCGDDATGPTAQEVAALADEIDGLRDRVEALEERPVPSAAPTTPSAEAPPTDNGEQPPGDDPAQPFEDPAGLFDDPEPLIGEDVTVTAEVVGLVSVSQVGAAFRLGGGEGTTVGVITVTPPGELEVGDVLRVTGPVERVRRSSFEADFGISADVLADDPETLFAALAGDVAIAARDIEVVRQPSG